MVSQLQCRLKQRKVCADLRMESNVSPHILRTSELQMLYSEKSYTNISYVQLHTARAS